MNEALPLTYTEAIIAIASRDPALAASIIHLHECVELLKYRLNAAIFWATWGLGGIGILLIAILAGILNLKIKGG